MKFISSCLPHFNDVHLIMIQSRLKCKLSTNIFEVISIPVREGERKKLIIGLFIECVHRRFCAFGDNRNDYLFYFCPESSPQKKSSPRLTLMFTTFSQLRVRIFLLIFFFLLLLVFEHL